MIYPLVQFHIRNRIHLSSLVRHEDYTGALAFLQSKERRDFPAGRALYADPRYANEEHITEMLERFDADTPEWIAAEYLEIAETAILMNLSMRNYRNDEETRKLVQTLGKSPGGGKPLQAIAEKVFQRCFNAVPTPSACNCWNGVLNRCSNVGTVLQGGVHTKCRNSCRKVQTGMLDYGAGCKIENGSACA